jgi:hypothetical protein
VLDHRPSGERVEDLGEPGPHAGALASGEHDGRQCCHSEITLLSEGERGRW